jgi:hypothetical protein
MEVPFVPNQEVLRFQLRELHFPEGFASIPAGELTRAALFLAKGKMDKLFGNDSSTRQIFKNGLGETLLRTTAAHGNRQEVVTTIVSGQPIETQEITEMDTGTIRKWTRYPKPDEASFRQEWEIISITEGNETNTYSEWREPTEIYKSKTITTFYEGADGQPRTRENQVVKRNDDGTIVEQIDTTVDLGKNGNKYAEKQVITMPGQTRITSNTYFDLYHPENRVTNREILHETATSDGTFVPTIRTADNLANRKRYVIEYGSDGKITTNYLTDM